MSSGDDRAQLRQLLQNKEAVKVLTELFSIGTEGKFGDYTGAEARDGVAFATGSKFDSTEKTTAAALDAVRKADPSAVGEIEKKMKEDDPFALVVQCPTAWHEADSQAVALALAKGRLQISKQTPMFIKHQTRRGEDGKERDVYTMCMPPGVRIDEMAEDQRQGAVQTLVDILARKQAAGEAFELDLQCPAFTSREDCEDGAAGKAAGCEWSFDTCVKSSMAIAPSP